MKHLFIELEVQDGENRHTHRVQHTTNAKNINFAAERFVSQYWGADSHIDEWWWAKGVMAMRVVKVIEMTEGEHKIMNKFFI